MIPVPPPPLVIEFDGGGYLTQYEERAKELVADGRRVVVRGICASACTMMVARVHERVCVEPGAEMWFHQASYEFVVTDRSDDGTRRMMRSYPKPLRQWIKARGGLSARWLKLRGAELRRLFLPCPGDVVADKGNSTR